MDSLKNIMFVDVRGFTGWLNSLGSANEMALDLIRHLYRQFNKKHFEYKKFLGDGVMVFSKASTTERGTKRDLIKLIAITNNTVDEFNKKRKEIESGLGVDCSTLGLGFGIAKGPINVINIPGESILEHVGERINLAARLCSLAKPSGIVVDRESFSSIPAEHEDLFLEKEVKKIAGFSERRVWVSHDVHIDNAHETFGTAEKLTEVHVTGLCTSKGELLLAKRADSRDIYPGRWAGPGGRVKKSESFDEALKRHFRDEAGVEIKDINLIKTYFIDTHKIPGLIFHCSLDSGEPVVNSEENQSMHWWKKEELDTLNLIPNLKDVAKKVLEQLKEDE